jgi:intraflagellar transport protein 80
MKLVLTEDSGCHDEICVGLAWSSASELFTCSDDQSIVKWQIGAGVQKGTAVATSTEVVAQLEGKNAYVTDMHWFPATKKVAGGGSDIFVVSSTDGSMRLMSKSGRVEKVVEGHKGAVVSVRWNYEGTALATCGEDGVVKIWSRAGMLRSTLVQNDSAIYAICWAPDSDQLCFSSGKHLVIKPLQPSAKQTRWKAHDAAVLKVDWNPVNDLIVSGGEDRRYKVWDSYGRQLYASAPFDYAVTSVAWQPGGEHFAIGAFNTLQVCDKTGWAACQKSTNTGSIVNLAWTADGTHVAGAGGNGTVCFAQLAEQRLESGNLEIVVTSADQIETIDLESEGSEPLELRDRISNVSVGFGHLVVATLTQICVYERTGSEWSTPHIVDLKDTPTLLLQCEKYFLVVDNTAGLQIFNYEVFGLAHRVPEQTLRRPFQRIPGDHRPRRTDHRADRGRRERQAHAAKSKPHAGNSKRWHLAGAWLARPQGLRDRPQPRPVCRVCKCERRSWQGAGRPAGIESDQDCEHGRLCNLAR